MKGNARNILIVSVFYGSLWGIAEAVLGYVLHMLPPGIAGFVMFPVGFCFMGRVYRRTNNAGAVFCAGLTAAAVKLVDLALPVVPVIRTVNPAISILLESLAVAAAFRLFARVNGKIGISGAVLSSMFWRGVFAAYLYILMLFSISSDIISGGIGSVAGFILLEGAANALIIYAYEYIYGRLAKKDAGNNAPAGRLRPSLPAAAFTAALAVTFVLSGFMP